jgi:small multidrug resistance family-3 protein
LRYSVALAILFVAATLEAGGDALVRAGIHSSTTAMRGVFLLAGAAVLFSYGYVVNTPPWDFGRLLGVYVAFFFVVAQGISWVFFSQKPTPAIWFGGAFIVVGGYIVSRG